MKRLIVSADDLNLTPGVSEAILDAHEKGIVTSASLMTNLPMSKALRKRIVQNSDLGMGIHLNVTYGEPVNRKSQVSSLLHNSGRFKKVPEFLESPMKEEEIYLEWDAQIQRFIHLLGKYPTHLDTHHQTHDRPVFFKVFCALSRKYYLPVRWSLLMKAVKIPKWYRTTDYFFGDLNPKDYWKKEKLEACLAALPHGLSEIMCHPGYSDSKLESISSFTEAREEEYRLLTSRPILEIIEKSEIVLTHFGIAYQ